MYQLVKKRQLKIWVRINLPIHWIGHGMSEFVFFAHFTLKKKKKQGQVRPVSILVLSTPNRQIRFPI